MQTKSFPPFIEALLGAGVRSEVIERLSASVRVKPFKAKEIVFCEEDHNPVIIFVLKGYLRLYVTDEEGDLSTRLLAGPGSFAGCIMATLYGVPAQYTAECLTDCELLLLDKTLIDKARETNETFIIIQDIIIKRLVEMMQEKALMLPMKATDRYLFFKERYPELVKHIPAGVLANYIGVRPQSLSRIKQLLR